jgi:hypothetical protein
MQFTEEEKAVIVNALEMRLQRCRDNHWDAEAEQLKAIIEKINSNIEIKGE